MSEQKKQPTPQYVRPPMGARAFSCDPIELTPQVFIRLVDNGDELLIALCRPDGHVLSYMMGILGDGVAYLYSGFDGHNVVATTDDEDQVMVIHDLNDKGPISFPSRGRRVDLEESANEHLTQTITAMEDELAMRTPTPVVVQQQREAIRWPASTMTRLRESLLQDTEAAISFDPDGDDPMDEDEDDDDRWVSMDEDDSER